MATPNHVAVGIENALHQGNSSLHAAAGPPTGPGGSTSPNNALAGIPHHFWAAKQNVVHLACATVSAILDDGSKAWIACPQREQHVSPASDGSTCQSGP
jgi:hypothetical protein